MPHAFLVPDVFLHRHHRDRHVAVGFFPLPERLQLFQQRFELVIRHLGLDHGGAAGKHLVSEVFSGFVFSPLPIA